MQKNIWRDGSAAWPVANPIISCASVSDSGFPSNFVADPFLYAKVFVVSLLCTCLLVRLSCYFGYRFYLIDLDTVC